MKGEKEKKAWRGNKKLHLQREREKEESIYPMKYVKSIDTQKSIKNDDKRGERESKIWKASALTTYKSCALSKKTWNVTRAYVRSISATEIRAGRLFETKFVRIKKDNQLEKQIL